MRTNAAGIAGEQTVVWPASEGILVVIDPASTRSSPLRARAGAGVESGQAPVAV